MKLWARLFGRGRFKVTVFSGFYNEISKQENIKMCSLMGKGVRIRLMSKKNGGGGECREDRAALAGRHWHSYRQGCGLQEDNWGNASRERLHPSKAPTCTNAN